MKWISMTCAQIRWRILSSDLKKGNYIFLHVVHFRSAKKIPKEELKKILEEKIKDPSIRQYVLMELKIQW